MTRAPLPTRPLFRALAVFVALLPTAAAQFHSHGSGCGAGSPPTLMPAVGARLDYGEAYDLEVHGGPTNAPGLLFVSLLGNEPGVPLDTFGMPGCRLYNAADIAVPILGNGSVSSTTFPMPNWPCRVRIHAQAAILDPAANALGVAWTQAAHLDLDAVSDTPVHWSGASTNVANFSVLDHPDLNGRPDAIFLARDGWIGTTDIGVWYDDNRERWTVFNQDQSPMSLHPFLLLLPNSGATTFRHRVTGGNTTGHITRLDHPAINGDPGALIQVTKLYVSGSGLAGYHQDPIGVWYDHGAARWTIFNQTLAPMPAAAAFQIVVADQHLAGVQTNRVYTASGAVLELPIRSPTLDGDDRGRIFLTQQFAPPGVPGAYNPNLQTVYFGYGLGHFWLLRNNSLPQQNIPANASFNVLQMDTVPRGESLVATAQSATTAVSVPGSTDDGARKMLVTGNWNPPGSGGVYFDHEVALQYDSTAHWRILRENGGSVTGGASFNCLVPNRTADAVLVGTTSGNTAGAAMTLDHPALNGRPDARPFVQAVDGVSNPHPTGVRWIPGLARWQIQNLDGAPMPTGKSFFVVVGNARTTPEIAFFDHTTTTANTILAHATLLDHPALNGRPDAHPVVTQRVSFWGVTNPHTIGVYYDHTIGKWLIFNQDIAPLVPNAEFQVMVRRDCD